MTVALFFPDSIAYLNGSDNVFSFLFLEIVKFLLQVVWFVARFPFVLIECILLREGFFSLNKHGISTQLPNLPFSARTTKLRLVCTCRTRWLVIPRLHP